MRLGHIWAQIIRQACSETTQSIIERPRTLSPMEGGEAVNVRAGKQTDSCPIIFSNDSNQRRIDCVALDMAVEVRVSRRHETSKADHSEVVTQAVTRLGLHSGPPHVNGQASYPGPVVILGMRMVIGRAIFDAGLAWVRDQLERLAVFLTALFEQGFLNGNGLSLSLIHALRLSRGRLSGGREYLDFLFSRITQRYPAFLMNGCCR